MAINYLQNDGYTVEINDTTPSDTTVYSSNKIESLLENVGGGNIDIMTYDLLVPSLSWVEGTGEYEGFFTFTYYNFLALQDGTQYDCIIDLAPELTSFKDELDAFAKIVKAEFNYNLKWSNTDVTLIATEKPSVNLTLNFMFIIGATKGSSSPVVNGEQMIILTNRSSSNSGGNATFINNAYLGNTQWVAEGDYYTQTFTLGEGDLSDKACIIDLRACDNNQEAYEHDLAEYAKIVKAELVYDGTYTSIEFTAKEALSGESGNLGLKVLLIDATDGISTYAPDGGGSTNTYESGKCFLTNRAPVNSGGSTVYEIRPLLNLYMFNDNNDDDIPYYSDITQLSSYGINENMKAVIIPTTDNDKASTLKYTECLSNGNIRCYFKENPTGYKIQAIEITPIKKITYYNENNDKTGN